MVKRIAIGILAILGVWAAWSLVTLPPAAIVLPASASARPVVTGAYHVHSKASDGTGTMEEIAAAAGRAGLNFVIVTDHGDAFRTPAPPRYYGRVLCIDATEISTTDGHYVAIGLGTPPYRLAGEGRDVVEDVARLGGFGVAAHPDSGRESLRWNEWDAPFDGIEWLNGDSQLREISAWQFFPILIQYAVRPAETLLSRFIRPQRALDRWDQLTARRRVVALAASDAHARLGLRNTGDPYGEALYLKLPTYEAVFRAFCLNVEVDAGPTGDAAIDARSILYALRNGRVFTTMSGRAAPANLQFTAWSATAATRQGGALPLDRGVMLRASANMPPGGALVLLKNGKIVQEGQGGEIRFATDQPGVFRVEARLSAASGSDALPWLLSNPIYVGVAPQESGIDSAAQVDFVSFPLPADWQIEHDPLSAGTAALVGDGAGAQREFQFHLADGAAPSPFVAMVTSGVAVLHDADQLRFRIRASRPLRVSVQVRLEGRAVDRRWVRSVYAEPAVRTVTVSLADMRAAGTGARTPFDRREIDALLFVIDTVNSRPGDQGTVWIDALETGRQVRTVSSR
ncbi:MAG: CehA/McbA family metallohydrolase [Acidobacteria bacterium]|nr:CehA/McbA family metallohydrolase [Acidobacteriota bacterium]